MSQKLTNHNIAELSTITGKSSISERKHQRGLGAMQTSRKYCSEIEAERA